MPSSLETSHSFTLGYSPRPPVSVCGTVYIRLCLENFLGNVLCSISQLPRISTLLGYIIKDRLRICQEPSLQHGRYIQLYAEHTTLRPSIASYARHGILTVCPSGAAFAIPLGPTNSWLIFIAKKTLVLRCVGFLPTLRLLVPTFLLRNAPEWVTPSPSWQMRTLSYRL